MEMLICSCTKLTPRLKRCMGEHMLGLVLLPGLRRKRYGMHLWIVLSVLVLCSLNFAALDGQIPCTLDSVKHNHFEPASEMLSRLQTSEEV